MRRVPGPDEQASQAPMHGPCDDGEGVGPLGQCPACGEPSPEPVFDGRQWNFLCLRCGTCAHVDAADKVETVDPQSCPGCRLRDFCQASPSPLARSLSARAVLGDGLFVTIRPLVHSDLPELCALGAKARAEMGRDFETNLLSRTFCEVSDVDTDCFTWIALIDGVPATPVAVATFRRCAEDATSARAALGVDSSFRGRGLGALLYEKLAETARAWGIESLRAEVSIQRPADIDVLASLALEPRPLGDDLAELHWRLRDRSAGAAHPAPLVDILERAAAGEPVAPTGSQVAHWVE